MTFEEFLASRVAGLGGVNPIAPGLLEPYAYRAPAAQPKYDWKPLLYTPAGQAANPGLQALAKGLLDDRSGNAGAYNLSNPYGSGWGNSGPGSASAPGGQGLGRDNTSLASKAIAVATSPLGYTSPLAQAMGLVGRMAMDSRLGALGNAADALGAMQAGNLPGMGTISDAYGNVRSYSDPDSIAAADRAMFGASFGDRGGSSSGGVGHGVNSSAGGPNGMGGFGGNHGFA